MVTPERDCRALLGLLLDEPTTHFSRAELVREMGWWPGRVDDALGELDRAGLVHRSNGFAFASRAAVRARELSV
jgi:hypothetical protein